MSRLAWCVVAFIIGCVAGVLGYRKYQQIRTINLPTAHPVDEVIDGKFKN